MWSYATEEVLDDLTKSVQARLLFCFTSNASWISVFHFGYLKLIVAIYRISLAPGLPSDSCFLLMKEKTYELTDLAFPMCISNNKSNLIFSGTNLINLCKIKLDVIGMGISS